MLQFFNVGEGIGQFGIGYWAIGEPVGSQRVGRASPAADCIRPTRRFSDHAWDGKNAGQGDMPTTIDNLIHLMGHQIPFRYLQNKFHN